MPLKDTIQAIVLPLPTEDTVREFVKLCHRIACTYLKKKKTTGRLHTDLIGLCIEDLALDCIADLFQRNEQNQFIQLDRYFSTLNVSTCSDAELLAFTRRLVFSAVNQRLFRVYKDSDPSLAKIIRNLKSALKYSATLAIVRKHDDLWVIPLGGGQKPDTRPSMPPEFVEIRLIRYIHPGASMKDFLAAVGTILTDEREYGSSIPLIDLALLIRMTYSDRSVAIDSGDSILDAMQRKDLEQLIRQSVEKVQRDMSLPYVGKRKIEPQTYRVYFCTIEEILNVQFLSDDGIDLSYFDQLKKNIGTLTREEYQEHHRIYLEYLAKLTREEFLRMVKKEL